MILLDQTQHLKNATFQYHLGDLPNKIMYKQSSFIDSLRSKWNQLYIIVVFVGAAKCTAVKDPHSINHLSVISPGAKFGVEIKHCWYFLLRFFWSHSERESIHFPWDPQWNLPGSLNLASSLALEASAPWSVLWCVAKGRWMQWRRRHSGL